MVGDLAKADPVCAEGVKKLKRAERAVLMSPRMSRHSAHGPASGLRKIAQ